MCGYFLGQHNINRIYRSEVVVFLAMHSSVKETFACMFLKNILA